MLYQHLINTPTNPPLLSLISLFFISWNLNLYLCNLDSDEKLAKDTEIQGLAKELAASSVKVLKHTAQPYTVITIIVDILYCLSFRECLKNLPHLRS